MTGGGSSSGGIGSDGDGACEDLLSRLSDAVVFPCVSGELFHNLVVCAASDPAAETRDFLQHRRLRPRGQREGSTLKMTRWHPSVSLAKWPIDGSGWRRRTSMSAA